MKQYSYKDFSATSQIKDVDGKKGIVTGYFSAFNNVDAYGDVIRKGAYSKTIIENGPSSAQPRIKHLLNHTVSQPIGKLMSLTEDGFGLAYESQVGTHTLGQDFVKMVESGLITEHSIGYEVMKSNQLQSYEDYMKNPAGGYNELTEIKLWEGSSLTGWGVNDKTPLTGLKSFTNEEIAERLKRLEKFCRHSTATDETIDLLLIECKQLSQLLIDNTQPQRTEPEEIKEDANEFAQVLTTFKNSLIKK